MTINYTTLLGLAKPVTGTESGVWGDVVNDQITSLLEDAIANAASISVTSGNVTLTDNNGSSDQSRMAILLVTGSPGVSRNIVAPSTSKWYIVKNSSNAQIVLKGSATTGVTIPAGAEAFAFWNGSDFELAAMIGPSSSTDNAVARFDGTTGKVVQNSAVTIADTTGDITTSGYVFTAAGAAGTPAYSTSGDTNTGMWFPAADTLAWSTGGSERMRVDASSRLVLNGTDATVGGGQMVVNHGANNGLVVNQTGSGTGAQIYLRNAVDSIINGINFTNSGVRFYDIGTATERMRISSGGVLSIGDTGTGDVTGAYIKATTITNSNYGVVRIQSAKTSDSTDTALSVIKQANDSTTAQVFVRFVINAAANGCGQINANGANTAAFGTYSDARLKENIVDLPPQLASICALRPVEFDYIQSEGGGHQIGFIAQEMEQVYPDVVGERSDGMKTITAWSKTEARLVKAIQEQQAIIDSLVSRIAALESKGA
jgi:hypothetical protein